jgi:O-antigen ligase
MEGTAASVAAPPAGVPAASGPAWPGAPWILAGVALAELGLLAAGFLSGHVAAAALLALAVAFFLVAFRFPDAAWMAVWVAFPFSIETTLSGGSAISVPTEPMIAVALAAWALRVLTGGEIRLPSSPMNPPLACLALVALLSVVASPYVLIGLKAWLVAAAYAAFGYLYFLTMPCNSARRVRWIRLVLATGVLWGAYGCVRVFQLGLAPLSAYGAARPFFPEHGTYSAYLSLILPLAFLGALHGSRRSRLGFAAAALVIGVGVTLSFTRAAWIAMVVVVPATLVVWTRSRRSWRSVLVPALVSASIVAVVALSGAVKSVRRHAESIVSTESVSNLERLNRWLAAWEMVKDRPLLGVGYGAYPDAYRVYRRKLVLTEESYQSMGAHSEPLRILSETGVLGFLGVLWLLSAAATLGLRAWRSAANLDARVLALAALAGLATYSLHGLFNAYLGMDKVTVPFWMSLGVIAALGRPRPAEA